MTEEQANEANEKLRRETEWAIRIHPNTKKPVRRGRGAAE